MFEIIIPLRINEDICLYIKIVHTGTFIIAKDKQTQ